MIIPVGEMLLSSLGPAELHGARSYRNASFGQIDFPN